MDLKLIKNFQYRVVDGDTLQLICQKFNTSEENIFRNNKDIDLYPGEWIEIAVNDYIPHVVKPTETLEKIAATYGIEISKIKQDNQLITDKLFIGQTLKIYK